MEKINLTSQELLLITEALYNPSIDLINIQGKDYQIFGTPSTEENNKSRWVKIGQTSWQEQKLSKEGKGILHTEGAQLRRLGHKIVWGVRSWDEWVYLVDGQVQKYGTLSHLLK